MKKWNEKVDDRLAQLERALARLGGAGASGAAQARLEDGLRKSIRDLSDGWIGVPVDFEQAGGWTDDHGGLDGLDDDDHSLYLLKSGLRDWDEQGGAPSTPATDKWKAYFKADGLYVMDDAGVETGPLGITGVTDHGALTGLADDDHTQYLLISGSRAMTGDLNMGSNAITSATTIYLNLVTKTADYTATNADHAIFVDASGGDVTITLPAGTSKKVFLIKRTSVTGTVYVEGTGEYFNEGSYLTLDYAGTEVVEVEWDGTVWQVIRRYQRAAADILTGFPVMMTTDAIGTIAADEYSGFGTSSIVATGDTRYRTVAPCAGTIYGLNVEIDADTIVGGEQWDLTLYKNGVATELTCTIGPGQTTGSDTTHRVTVAAGDVLTVYYDETGTLSHGFAVTFIYEAQYQPFFGCVNAGRSDLGQAYYGDLQNARYNGSGLDEAATVFSCNGTIQNFYVHAPSCDTSGDQATLTLRVFDPSAGTWSNVSPTVQLVLDYDADGDSMSDLVTTFDVEAGKAYQWKCEDTSGTPPKVSQVAVSFVFVPETPGDIVISGFSDQFFSNPAYIGLMASEADDSTGSTALQANVTMPVSVTLQDMYVVLQAAPGATNKVYTATVMKNGSASLLAATVTDPSRTGNDTSNTVSFDAATDTVGLRFTDDSTVSPTWGAWAVVARL